MSWVWKSSKLQVPIKQCLSFIEDHCFNRATSTLKEFGVDWTDISKPRNTKLDKQIPKMDAVFFHSDRFDLLIDARGFRPEDIKCKMSPNLIEIIGQRQENANSGNKSMTLSRNYQLPQAVKPEEGNCFFSTEGVLLVSAPWQAT
ncbi:alpha-crystallin B chain-like [Diorhabda carinulata]|uniref:alpha-crystallin B chain-like n=1 Tax=Diorhabda sublineata TaxID=1163346 RepID=UPI0024E130AD|nr:alpha-crystallin B chain-like [Diorhabda sublineata]XP_057664345.1 alpha-crystallin B chain-like [Diorhabda carinulata]